MFLFAFSFYFLLNFSYIIYMSTRKALQRIFANSKASKSLKIQKEINKLLLLEGALYLPNLQKVGEKIFDR